MRTWTTPGLQNWFCNLQGSGGREGHTPLTPAACRATLPGLFHCYLFCLLGGKSYVCKPHFELPQQEKSRGRRRWFGDDAKREEAQICFWVIRASPTPREPSFGGGKKGAWLSQQVVKMGPRRRAASGQRAGWSYRQSQQSRNQTSVSCQLTTSSALT